MESWEIEIDPHRMNPLVICALPDNVKRLRSFIGAYRSLSRCIPNYGKYICALYICALEDTVAGKELFDKIPWGDKLRNIFVTSQKSLMNPKTSPLSPIRKTS